MHGKLSLGSLRARLLLAALSWVVVAIPLGGVALALSFRSVITEKFDDQLGSLLLLLIGSAEATPAGEIGIARPLADPRFQQAYSGWYWVIRSGDRQVLRSRSLWDLAFYADVAPISATPRLRTIRDSLGADLRVLQQTVALPGVPSPVTFAVAGDLASLHEEARAFNRLLWFWLLALGAGLALAVVTQVSLGLKPLRRVAAEVEHIRTGDARQLSNTGLREIDALVHEVNTLIDQDRAQLERARTNAADLAHALKTPLAVLRSSAEGEERNEQLEQLDSMQRIIERQLARAASAGPRRGVATAVNPVAEALVGGMRRIHAERNLDVRYQAVGAPLFAGDAEDLEEMLGNLLDNACKWARSEVAATAESRDGRLLIQIDDDGPGLTEAQATLARERGRRFDSEAPGSGLGLAIISDLATLYGGALELTRAALGGMRATLLLPAVREKAESD
jgi:signal transduction histidine kinase